MKNINIQFRIKNYKIFLLLFFALTLFNSCSKEEINFSEIICNGNSWKLNGVVIIDGVRNDNGYPGDFITFNKDNTASILWTTFNKITKFNWVYYDNTIVLDEVYGAENYSFSIADNQDKENQIWTTEIDNSTIYEWNLSQ